MAAGKGAMTERERMKALLRRERPDRVPICSYAIGFFTYYTRGSIAEAYNNPKVALESQRKACRDFGWLNLPLYSYLFGAWEFGGEVKWPSGEFSQAPMVVRHPVETPEDALSLKMPDVKTAGFTPLLTEFAKLSLRDVPDNELFPAPSCSEGPFVIASMMCNIEKLGRWMIKKPEVAHHLLRLATDYLTELMQYWKDTFGTDILIRDHEATTSNQLISPKQFKEFAFPYIKEHCETALAMGFKTIFTHLCGDQNLNLPYWAQIPFGDPGIISIGHEVELETAAEYFPNDIIFGNLNPAIIQSGTPEEVYEASKVVVERGKALPNGFIFAPGCELPPMAPLENLREMNRAVEDFGWY